MSHFFFFLQRKLNVIWQIASECLPLSLSGCLARWVMMEEESIAYKKKKISAGSAVTIFDHLFLKGLFVICNTLRAFLNSYKLQLWTIRPSPSLSISYTSLWMICLRCIMLPACGISLWGTLGTVQIMWLKARPRLLRLSASLSLTVRHNAEVPQSPIKLSTMTPAVL